MWTVSEIICLGSLAGLSIADIHYRKVPGEILAMGAVGACVYRICMEQENVWILGGGIAIGILFLFISRVTGEKLAENRFCGRVGQFTTDFSRDACKYSRRIFSSSVVPISTVEAVIA